MSNLKGGVIADFSQYRSSNVVWNLHLRRGVRDIELDEVYAFHLLASVNRNLHAQDVKSVVLRRIRLSKFQGHYRRMRGLLSI